MPFVIQHDIGPREIIVDYACVVYLSKNLQDFLAVSCYLLVSYGIQFCHPKPKDTTLIPERFGQNVYGSCVWRACRKKSEERKLFCDHLPLLFVDGNFADGEVGCRVVK